MSATPIVRKAPVAVGILENIPPESPSQVRERAPTKLLAAKAVSLLASAPMLAIPSFAAILLLPKGLDDARIVDLVISLAFGSAVPVLGAVAFPAKVSRLFDFKEERTRPLLFGAVGYFVGTGILVTVSAPVFAILLMFCYGTNTLAVLFINHYWKISIHSMGVAGPTTALIYTFGLAGALFGLVLLPVAWSRLYLKKHTGGQILAGASLGYLMTTVQFWVIGTRLFNTVTNFALDALLATALMLPPVVLVVWYRSSDLTRSMGAGT